MISESITFNKVSSAHRIFFLQTDAWVKIHVQSSVHNKEYKSFSLIIVKLFVSFVSCCPITEKMLIF